MLDDLAETKSTSRYTAMAGCAGSRTAAGDPRLEHTANSRSRLLAASNAAADRRICR